MDGKGTATTLNGEVGIGDKRDGDGKVVVEVLCAGVVGSEPIGETTREWTGETTEALVGETKVDRTGERKEIGEDAPLACKGDGSAPPTTRTPSKYKSVSC